MEPDDIQAVAARDQLWASLRQLQADIERLSQGGFQEDDRDRQLVQLIAQIVQAELKFRAERPE